MPKFERCALSADSINVLTENKMLKEQNRVLKTELLASGRRDEAGEWGDFVSARVCVYVTTGETAPATPALAFKLRSESSATSEPLSEDPSNAGIVECAEVCIGLTCEAYSEQACNQMQTLNCNCQGCDCQRQLEEEEAVSTYAPDEATLRAALAANHSASVIDVGSATTIELRSELQVENTVKLTGMASALVAVGTHRLIRVAPGAALELSGLTLANGAAYGVGDADNGGCVLVGAGATLTTSKTTFSDCVAGFLSMRSVRACFEFHFSTQLFSIVCVESTCHVPL